MFPTHFFVDLPTSRVRNVICNDLDEAGAELRKKKPILITNTAIVGHYCNFVSSFPHIVVDDGEQFKNTVTVNEITQQLLALEATREHTIVGFGGGVVTDIAGYVAATYMRGVDYVAMPTSLLAMVDAAIGGKNGVNVGPHKNVLGTITQPSNVYFCTALLKTLPEAEWINAFAEIIKYACVFDKELFYHLMDKDLAYFQQNPSALQELISKCVRIKYGVVAEDEKEMGNRKLLNFGHTAGHAIETLYSLPHGQAVAIGMVIAANLSSATTGFSETSTTELSTLLTRYGLSIHQQINVADIIQLMRTDKKRTQNEVHYVLLNSIGKGSVHRLPFSTVENCLIKWSLL
jgi:3-dehydroquinate synthase